MLVKRYAIVSSPHKIEFKRIRYVTRKNAEINCGGCSSGGIIGGISCQVKSLCSHIYGNSGWVTKNRDYKYVLK